MGIFMKIGWIAMKVHSISNIYNNNNNNSNNSIRHKEVYRLLDRRQREWEHKFLYQCLDHQNYKYQLIDQDLQKSNHLSLGWGVD